MSVMKIFTNDEKRLLNVVREILMSLEEKPDRDYKTAHDILLARSVIKKVLEEDAEAFIEGRFFYEVGHTEPGHFPLPSRLASQWD